MLTGSAARHVADGNMIVTESRKGARIFTSTTGELIGQFVLDSNNIRSAAYTREGTRLALATEDGAISVFDTTNKRAQFTVDLGSDVIDMRFSSDGERLTVVTQMGIHSYASKDGAELISFNNYFFIESGSVAPDASEVAVATENGALIYSLEFDSLLDVARKRNAIFKDAGWPLAMMQEPT